LGTIFKNIGLNTKGMKNLNKLPVLIALIMLGSCNNENAGEKNGTVNTHDSLTSPRKDTGSQGSMDTTRALFDRTDSSHNN